jgi:hypothetical protein
VPSPIRLYSDEERRERKRIHDRAYCERNREMLRERSRTWRKNHPKPKKERKCNVDDSGNKRKYIRKNRAAYDHPYKRKYQYLLRYGITVEEYEQIWYSQNGCCAICGIAEKELKKKLHIDHNHTTGRIRGLLCSNCNIAIGLLKDDIVRLSKAIEYLALDL